MLRRLTAMAFMGCVLALGGCNAAGGYLQARTADLADVFSVELTAGSGTDFHGQCTSYIGTAAGWSSQKGIVMRGRRIGTGRRETAGVLLFGATATDGVDGGDDASPEAMGSYKLWAVLLPLSFKVGPAMHVGYVPSWPHLLDVEVGGSLGVGFHFGVSPGEALDLAFGLIGLDPARDDPRPGGKPQPLGEDLPPVMFLPPEWLDRWIP